MPRPQLTFRALLVLILMVACFFGGIRFERERKRREEKTILVPVPAFDFKSVPLPTVAQRRAKGLRSHSVSDADFDWRPVPSPVRPLTWE